MATSWNYIVLQLKCILFQLLAKTTLLMLILTFILVSVLVKYNNLERYSTHLHIIHKTDKIITVECKSSQCGNELCVSADSAGFVFVHLHSVNKPPSLLYLSLSLCVLAISHSVSGLVNAGVCMCFLSWAARMIFQPSAVSAVAGIFPIDRWAVTACCSMAVFNSQHSQPARQLTEKYPTAAQKRT